MFTLLRNLYHGARFHVGQRVRSRHLLAAVARHVPPSGRVLDAGSGGGRLALAVAENHPELEVDGIELAPDKVTQSEAGAVERGLPNVRFVVGDLTRIGRIGEYDLVYSVDVLEHVADDGAAMRSIAAALRPGGIALIHVPRARPRRFFPALADHHQDDHVRDGYEPDDLRVRLTAAGLAVVAIDRTFGPAGELAWELAELLRSGGSSRARECVWVALAPLLALLCELDFRLGGGPDGNGLLVRARRPAATAAAS